MKVFLDCEATDKNWATAELIELFMKTDCGQEFLIQSKVNKWSHEAEKIHKIPLEDTAFFTPKNIAIKKVYDILSQFPEDAEFIMYANTSIGNSSVYFDTALLEYEIMNMGLDFKFKNKLSVHTMARLAYQKKLFEPLKNPETNRISFSQAKVYEAIFGHKPQGSHRAKTDVLVMEKIYYVLLDALENNTKININQLSLI